MWVEPQDWNAQAGRDPLGDARGAPAEHVVGGVGERREHRHDERANRQCVGNDVPRQPADQAIGDNCAEVGILQRDGSAPAELAPVDDRRPRVPRHGGAHQ